VKWRFAVTWPGKVVTGAEGSQSDVGKTVADTRVSPVAICSRCHQLYQRPRRPTNSDGDRVKSGRAFHGDQRPDSCTIRRPAPRSSRAREQLNLREVVGPIAAVSWRGGGCQNVAESPGFMPLCGSVSIPDCLTRGVRRRGVLDWPGRANNGRVSVGQIRSARSPARIVGCHRYLGFHGRCPGRKASGALHALRWMPNLMAKAS